MPDEDPFKKAQEDLRRIELDDIEEPNEVEARFLELEKKFDSERVELPNTGAFEDIESRLLELEGELEVAKQQRKNGDALFDAEFEQRLEAFHGRVDKMKETRQEKERDTHRTQVRDRDSARGLGIGLSIAYTIIGMPLAGAGLGWLLDRALGTQTFVGIGVLVFGALGMFVALFVLSRNDKK